MTRSVPPELLSTDDAPATDGAFAAFALSSSVPLSSASSAPAPVVPLVPTSAPVVPPAAASTPVVPPAAASAPAAPLASAPVISPAPTSAPVVPPTSASTPVAPPAPTSTSTLVAPPVAVVIPTYNEERFVLSLFESIIAQDYPHEAIEVLFVDGRSRDTTRALVEGLILAHTAPAGAGFARICLLDNPGRITSTALNVGISSSATDIIVKLDAHAVVPPSFISRRVAIIAQGEKVGGGPWFPLIDNETPWKRALLAGEQSVFGSSVASYRRALEPGYVASISHGIYSREVFERAGLFDERLERTEDNEFHYRVREAGYQIRFEPEAYSYHHMRSTYRSMLKQKYGNGLWVGRTLFIERHCLRLFHLIPAVFVFGLLLATALGGALSWLPLLALALIYLAAALGATLQALLRAEKGKRSLFFSALPFVFLSMHLAYGVGTLVGLVVGATRGTGRKPRRKRASQRSGEGR